MPCDRALPSAAAAKQPHRLPPSQPILGWETGNCQSLCSFCGFWVLLPHPFLSPGQRIKPSWCTRIPDHPKDPFFSVLCLVSAGFAAELSSPWAHGSTKPLQKVVNPTPAIPSAPAGAVGEQLSITTGFIHCYLFPFSRSRGVLSPPGACSIPGGRNTPSSFFAFQFFPLFYPVLGSHESTTYSSPDCVPRGSPAPLGWVS